MAIYRNVMMNFWTDRKVSDEFTPEDRYFYLYLFTNPHTNLCGCYEVSFKQAVVETGYSRDSIENLIKRFEKVHDVVRYSSKTGEILLLNWHKYNWTSSEKFRKPLLEQIKAIKCEEFKEYLMALFLKDDEDTVSIPYQYPIDTTDTVTVTDTVSDTKTIKKVRNMIPPTIEMVEDYINDHGYEVNAHAFMDFYDSKGWVVGKSKMRDWQAAVRTWAHNEYGNNKKPSANPFYEMLQKGDY